jgi:hypothetical protein
MISKWIETDARTFTRDVLEWRASSLQHVDGMRKVKVDSLREGEILSGELRK